MHVMSDLQVRDNWGEEAKTQKEFKLPCCQPWDLPIKIKSIEYAWFSVAHWEGDSRKLVTSHYMSSFFPVNKGMAECDSSVYSTGQPHCWGAQHRYVSASFPLSPLSYFNKKDCYKRACAKSYANKSWLIRWFSDVKSYFLGYQRFLVLLHFTFLSFADTFFFFFLPIEGKTLHQQMDYNSLQAQMMVIIFQQ